MKYLTLRDNDAVFANCITGDSRCAAIEKVACIRLTLPNDVSEYHTAFRDDASDREILVARSLYLRLR